MNKLFNNIYSFLHTGGVKLLLFFIALYTSLWSINVYIILLFTIVTIVSVPYRKYWNNDCLYIILFSLSYFIALLTLKIESWSILITTVISPITFYMYGNHIVSKYKSDKLIITFWLLSIIFFSINLFINIFRSITENGIVLYMREIEISGSTDIISATLLGLNLSLGLVGFSFYFNKKESFFSIQKIAFLCVAIFSLISAVHLINRTSIFVLIISFIVVNIYYSKRNLFRRIIVLIFVSIIFILLINSTNFGQDILDAYKIRIGTDSIETAGGRTFRWNEAFVNILKYPFGWYDTSVEYYAHNLWLDIARVSGIVPFILFLLITFKSVINLIKLTRIKNNSLISLILGLNICFCLSSFVEPVIEGLPIFFYLYILLFGMQNRLVYGEEILFKHG